MKSLYSKEDQDKRVADDKLSTGARLARGSFMRILSSFVSVAVGFFMMPFMVSHLGDYWYGIWISIGSLVGNLFLLDLGLTMGVMRYVTEALAKNDADAANRVISTVFWILCLIALLIILITVIMAALAIPILGMDSDIRIPILILISGLNLALGFPLNAMAGIIQSRLRYDLLVKRQLALMIVSVGLTVYLLRNGYGVIALALTGLLLGIVSNMVFVLIAKSVFPQLTIARRYFTRELARELFTFSIWAFVTNFSNQIRLRIDALVVAGVRSATAVTHYLAGARPGEITNEFLYQATNIIQPVLTRYHTTGDYERMHWALIFLTKINVALGCFASGMLLLLGEPFIVRWMGEKFADSSSVLYLITLALTAGFIVNPLDNAIYAIRRPRFLALVNLLDGTVNLGSSIWLGLSFGLVGVAWGTLIPMVVTRFFVVAPYACKHTGLSISRYAVCILRTVAVAALVLVPMAFMVQPFLQGSGYGTFIIIALVAGLIYTPALFYGALNSSERSQLITLFWRPRLAAVPI